MVFTSAPLVERRIQLMSIVSTTLPKIQKCSYCSGHKGNHGNWNLHFLISVASFESWEQESESPSKRCGPSGKKHVSDDIDDLLRYCRNVRLTWVKFDSKDTKESEWCSRFEVLSPRRGLR